MFSLPSEKIDTLCLLVQRIVEENNALKGEIVSVGDQCEKQREAKEAIKSLNNAYKKQVCLPVISGPFLSCHPFVMREMTRSVRRHMCDNYPYS